MFSSQVFLSNSVIRLRCARNLALYAVAVKATSTCSPVTHSSTLFSIWKNQNDKSRYIPVLNLEIKAYHCQHKSDRNHSEYAILRKLGVNNTIIFFVLEPDFVNDGLDKGGTKYSGFGCRNLSVMVKTVSGIQLYRDSVLPCIWTEILLKVVQRGPESRALWIHVCRSRMQI